MSLLMRRGIMSSAKGGIFAANTSDLNGSSQLFNAGNPSALQITGDMTVSLWLKASVDITVQALVSKYSFSNDQRGYVLDIDAGGFPRFTLSADGSSTGNIGVTADTSTTDGSFNMITAVYNGVDIRIYNNGSLDSTPVARTGSVFNSSADFYIGAYSDSGGDTLHLEGCPAMVYVSNTALSAGDVLSMYSDTETAKCFNQLSASIQSASVYAPRLANWGSNSGDELIDQSTSGITTTNVGSTPFTGTGLSVQC